MEKERQFREELDRINRENAKIIKINEKQTQQVEEDHEMRQRDHEETKARIEYEDKQLKDTFEMNEKVSKINEAENLDKNARSLARRIAQEKQQKRAKEMRHKA